jgi:hypothetical protein
MDITVVVGMVLYNRHGLENNAPFKNKTQPVAIQLLHV